MTAATWVSLVIVSRGRAAALRRLLSSLEFQTHPTFEVVIVSDQPDLSGYPSCERVRHQHFDTPNISAARNIGVSMARCDLVAFCDDDAVPDPWWLERLIGVFADPEVGAAGGYVRGRNGIEYQWKASGFNDCGDDVALQLNGDEPQVFRFANGVWPRVHGTNCAFRMKAIQDVGGFDEGFRFFLDETDLCMRIGQAGWATGIVPLAQVQHGFAQSDQRSADRVPRTFFEIGASKALFLSKHAAGDTGASIELMKRDRRAQLLELMVAGRIEPRDVSRLLRTLDKGLGSIAESIMAADLDRRETAQPIAFNSTPCKGATAVAGSRFSAQTMVNFSEKIRQKRLAMLMLKFSFTTLFHKRWYDERGFWMQAGGLFGKSRRGGKAVRVATIESRALEELNELKRIFPVDGLTVFRKFRNFVSHSPDSPTR